MLKPSKIPISTCMTAINEFFSLKFRILKHTNFKNIFVMAVMKVIEVMASSSKSWEEATRNAVEHASKSVKHLKSAFVQSQSVVIDDNEISEFRVNVKITFEVK
jgi:flavin-binding protein dodecin